MARRDRRRATTGAFAASILVHLALFALLAYQAAPVFRAAPEAAPDFTLQLVRAPPTVAPAPRSAAARRETRPVPVLAPAPPRRRPPPFVRPLPSLPPAPPQRAPLPPRTPQPPAPAAPAQSASPRASAAGAGQKGATARWTVQSDDEGQDGVRKFLRATVGCSHEDYVRLTEPERAACNRRIGEEARSLSIPADKLAGFIAAAEAQERGRAERNGPVRDLFEPCRGQGSNLDRSCLNPPAHPPDD